MCGEELPGGLGGKKSCLTPGEPIESHRRGEGGKDKEEDEKCKEERDNMTQRGEKQKSSRQH